MKEELNKKEFLIKDLVETKNLTTNSLKQQKPIQSQSFTPDADKNDYTSTVSPVNYKEINLTPI